jgi:hypothetical protein
MRRQNILKLDARYDGKQIGTQPAGVVPRGVDTEREDLSPLTSPAQDPNPLHRVSA